jgi:putative intracellular protease/amidase
VSDAVLAALPSATRVSGPERYATSLAIAAYWAERDMRLETVHVATGRDFPDALAAGPVAALARGPLLLVDGLSADAPDATYAWLRERRDEIDGAYAFGGNGVMVEPVLQRLRDAIGDGG